jgi:hypothetical protein
LLNYIGTLNGKLLIILGTIDNTVIWQSSLAFIDEYIKQDKQVDYLVSHGLAHNIVGKARVHLFT